MKFSSVGNKAESLQRRERWRRDHAAARTLASAFPQVERICINLRFTDAGLARVAPQSYVMHPPAQAFFDFPCPYADCDGHFDLTDVVKEIVSGRQDLMENKSDCAGARMRPKVAKQPCLLHLNYSVSVRYR